MTLKDLTGQTLGQYELRELIGAGGMGAVYRGYQTSLQRAVAVKVLSTALAEEPGYLERFYREARTAAALEHAHIVPVYDYGIQRELSYVIMRLLTGGTLSDRMQRRANTSQPLPSPGEIANLLRQIASALDYAHSQGVIHRDIKPSNIMFDNQGNAYLVDFGIAKLLSATSALTGTGTTMGTPAFMPPEQWRSEDLTPAADQYAMAVTLYALLVGRTPYEATTPFGLMHKHLNEMPTPAHLQRPDLPQDVTLVLERALAKKPEDRFLSVTAFAQAFDGAITGVTGTHTGFFTMNLPRPGPARTLATLPPEQAATPPPELDAPTFTPATPPPTPRAEIVSAPKVTMPEPAYAQPSPRSGPVQLPKPASRRSPAVWVLAAALVIALGVIGFLVLGSQNEKKATPTSGPVAGAVTPATTIPAASATAEASAITPEMTTAAPVIAVLPTDTPELTATSAPTETPQPSATPTVPPTQTPPPSATPTIPPTQTPLPSATPTIPPTQTPLPSATPTIPPTQTPVPTATPVAVAQVEVVDIPPGTVLVVGPSETHVHGQPDSSAEVIALVSNEQLPVTGMTADKEWFRVQINGQEGWVREAPGVTLAAEEAAPSGPVVVVPATGGVVLRSEPSFDSKESQAVSDVRLPILGRTADSVWLRVDYNGQSWWVRRSASVQIEGDLETVAVVEGAAPSGPVVVVPATGGVVLRSEPSFDSKESQAVSDVRLPILGRTADNAWLRVDYNGQSWWVRRSASVQIEGDLETVAVVEEAAPSGPVVVIGAATVSLRSEPSFDAKESQVVSDVRLPILGRTADDTWLRVDYNGQPWWVRRSASVQIEGDLEAVAVVEEAVPAEVVTYTTVLNGVVTSLDPQRLVPDDASSIEIAEQLFMGLTAMDPDHPGEVVPRLAEGWSVSADKLVWTFSLHPDVPWLIWNADQKQPQVWRPVTASDFVYAIQRACDPRLGNWYNYVLAEVIQGCDQLAAIAPDQASDSDYDLVQVSAPDDTTLVVHLSYPAAHFLSLTTLWLLRPVPPELVAKFGDEWATPPNIATNGAFVLAGTDGVRFVLVRNPALPDSLRGPGNVNVAVVMRVENLARALDLFRKQQVDSEPLFSSDLGPAAPDPQAFQAANVVPSQTVLFLGLTYDKPPFDNVLVRRAFAYAIDRQALIDEVIPNEAVPMLHLIPPGSVGAPEMDAVGAGFSPDIARKALADAGYPDCAGLPPITIAIRPNTNAWAKSMIAGFKRELGCPITLFTVQSYSPDELNTLLANGSAEERPNLWLGGWTADYPDANNWVLDPLGCGMSNFMRRPCTDADNLIDAADQEPDPSTRHKMYLDLETYFFGPEGEFPIIPLALRVNYRLAQPWVSGPLQTDGIFGGRHYDWITIDPQAQPDAQGSS